MDDEDFEYSKEIQFAEDVLNEHDEDSTIESIYQEVMTHTVISIAKSLELLAADVAAIKRTLG